MSPTGREENSGESLTQGDEPLHFAASVARADQIEDIEIESFLDTLVDIAFAVAVRRAKEKQEEQST